MRLRHSPFSPFVRKVLVCAHEKGLAGRIELVPTSPNEDATLAAENPLRLIPSLVTDDGMALFDSPVICEYLEQLAPQPALLPADPKARLAALRLQVVGDGIGDAAVGRRMEFLRPDGEKSAANMAKLGARVAAAADWLEAHRGELDGPPTLGSIAVACALGYLDLRFGHEDWRPGRPALAAWYASFCERPSMQATAAKG